MKHEILYSPAFAVARVMLDPGDSIRAESGAMASMSPTVELESKVTGGLGKALGRLLGGESLFQSTYTAKHGPGEVLLAPVGPGDIACIDVVEPTYVTNGAYLAGDISLQMETKASLKGFFAGEGLFMVRMSGHGQLLVGCFGAIHAVRLAHGQPYSVDTGHLVAFTEGMGFELKRASRGLIGSFTSGEGIVAQMTGPGTVWMQTRSPQTFASWLGSMLPGRG